MTNALDAQNTSGVVIAVLSTVSFRVLICQVEETTSQEPDFDENDTLFAS